MTIQQMLLRPSVLPFVVLPTGTVTVLTNKWQSSEPGNPWFVVITSWASFTVQNAIGQPTLSLVKNSGNDQLQATVVGTSVNFSAEVAVGVTYVGNYTATITDQGGNSAVRGINVTFSYLP